MYFFINTLSFFGQTVFGRFAPFGKPIGYAPHTAFANPKRKPVKFKSLILPTTAKCTNSVGRNFVCFRCRPCLATARRRPPPQHTKFLPDILCTFCCSGEYKFRSAENHTAFLLKTKIGYVSCRSGSVGKPRKTLGSRKEIRTPFPRRRTGSAYRVPPFKNSYKETCQAPP